jgi:hypothetical protein
MVDPLLAMLVDYLRQRGRMPRGVLRDPAKLARFAAEVNHLATELADSLGDLAGRTRDRAALSSVVTEHELMLLWRSRFFRERFTCPPPDEPARQSARRAGDGH